MSRNSTSPAISMESSKEEAPPRLRLDLAKAAFHLLRGKMAAIRLRHLHGIIFHEMQPFGWHLERDLFPALRRKKQSTLTLQTDTQVCALRNDPHAGLLLQQAPNTAAKLAALGIRELILDTRLEAGQVPEAILLILHAGPVLGRVDASDTPYGGWNAHKMAAAMLGLAGYKRFCMRVSLHHTLQRLEIRYEYCPLIMTRVMQRQMEKSARYNDHRTFFHMAPRMAVLVFLLFLLPEAFHAWGTLPAGIATLGMALLAAAIVGVGLHAMGSQQYDKEHYDKIKDSYHRQARYLSRFPEANPNPVLALNNAGDITYANGAAARYFSERENAENSKGAVVPESILSAAARCLEQSGQDISEEVVVHGRHISLMLRAFPDDDAVIVSGTDVTALRDAEALLREINGTLERAVKERTKELEVTRDVTILALAGLAEKRDPETGFHLERTRHYVRILAERLTTHPRFAPFLTAQAIDRLFKSAPLHDIGKVGVPDAILLKPDKLTPEEFEAIKQHTTYGGDALRAADEKLGFDSFLSMGKEIAYYHHERWDGQGYPFGLSGEDIPWPARLMAVADVYDALTSRRPYKEPWPHEQARDEIARLRGDHLDPDVVDAFLAAQESFQHVAREFDEARAGMHN